MASRNHSNSDLVKAVSAFTLIEMLVVIGILVIVAGFGLIVGMDSFRGYQFRSERDQVVALLQRARSQAINNMCFSAGTPCTGGKPHGVYLGTSHEYVIFQGTSYASRDAAVDEVVRAKADTVAVTGFTEVVFSQLAATTTPLPLGVRSLSVYDTGGTGTSTITVSPEGQITWTN